MACGADIELAARASRGRGAAGGSTVKNLAPRVSIGVPVRDGAAYLVQAIESLRSQSFSEIEILIADNASTDATGEICRDFSDRDPRIHYYRQAENVGAAANFNRTFEMASGEFFKWAAHDDICHPDFVSRCVDVLDSDPRAVLAYPRVAVIDGADKVVGCKNFELRGELARPSDRFRFQTVMNHWCFHVFGLIRTEALRQTRLIDNFVASDRVLLAHLALLGRFVEVPDELFFHREHADRSTKAIVKLHQRAGWFDPKKAGKTVFPNWRLLVEYQRIIGRAGIDLHERWACRVQLLRWLRRYWKAMIGDIAAASRPSGAADGTG